MAGLYRVVQGLLGLFPEAASYTIPGWSGASVGIFSLPALVGVGYLVNIKIASVLLGGGILAALVITPLISFFGSYITGAVFPASIPIAQLGIDGIWSEYIQYIGAGALTIGGVLEFIKSMPVVCDAIVGAVGTFKERRKNGSSNEDRREKDLSFKWIALIFVSIVVLVAVLPVFPVGVVGALMVAVFGFLFVSISSRIVGIVGSSSNPISGMTITTIFASAILFKALGFSGSYGAVASIAVGSIVTVAASVAGDTSQDLKTGYIIGATPRSQQVMEILTILIFAGVSGVIFSLLHKAYVIGSEALPAPATAVIAILVEGIFSGQLPWGLLLIGAAIGLMVALMGLPTLPFAIGVYLPLGLTTPMFLGGLVRYLLERKNQDNDTGTLYSFGLVAGDALVGVLGALLTTAGFSLSFASTWLGKSTGQIVATLAIFAIAVSIHTTTKRGNKVNEG